MEKLITRVLRMVRRLPLMPQAEAAARRHLPEPVKRLIRRTRHRAVMRSPRSLLARAITPGVENRLLSNPGVVDKLLRSERGLEILNHSTGHDADWVAQVALSDPGSVVQTLSNLARRHGHVDAAIDRLVAERSAVLTEEQVADVFLALDAFERHKYWTNPRIRNALLEDLRQDSELAELRESLLAQSDHGDGGRQVPQPRSSSATRRQASRTASGR